MGSGNDNTVSIWDRRQIARSTARSTLDAAASAPVLEIRSIVDSSSNAGVWSLRYSGIRRGLFSVLSSTGQLTSFETSQFRQPTAIKSSPSSSLEDTSQNQHFIRKTTHLEYPWNHVEHGQEANTRAIAFDWVTSDTAVEDPRIVSMRKDRTVEIRHTNTTNTFASISVLDELVIGSPVPVSIRAGKTVTEDADQDVRDDRTMAEVMSRADLSSRERHAAMLLSNRGTDERTLDDILTSVGTAKRRCMEGYLFDCERNKEIVKNDPWLVEFWNTIQRLERLAEDDAMIADPLDLSYLGVHNILVSDLGSNAARHSQDAGVTVTSFTSAVKTIKTRLRVPDFPKSLVTSIPHQRQLGLLLCDWHFSDFELDKMCTGLISEGQHYQAIAAAVFHDNRDMAIDLVRTLTRSAVIPNTGLAAVIACDTVSKEQRILCKWMAEDAEDPYLRALLLLFVTGEWLSVADMVELPLRYRVAVALRYLDDKRLIDFLDRASAAAITYGDLGGIVLTGLAESSMQLLQAYFARTSDLQTAVLAAGFTNPHYVIDSRWQTWKEAYLDCMQTWGTLMPRTRFKVQHNRRVLGHGGGLQSARLAPRQVSLRCLYCQKPAARRVTAAASNGTVAAAQRTPGHAAGTVCQRCGRHMPRCAVCMMWLGTPDAMRPGAGAGLNSKAAQGVNAGTRTSIAGPAAALPPEGPNAKVPAQAFAAITGSGSDRVAIEWPPSGNEDYLRQEVLSGYVTFCMKCSHGSHASHAREWFARHQICPASDCQCLCMAR